MEWYAGIYKYPHTRDVVGNLYDIHQQYQQTNPGIRRELSSITASKQIYR